MRTVIHAFYMTAFGGVGVLGLIGDGFYLAWAKNPATALKVTSMLFFVAWCIAIGLLALLDFLNWDWLTVGFGRFKNFSSFDAISAAYRQANARKVFCLRMRGFGHEQSDAAKRFSATPHHGDDQ